MVAPRTPPSSLSSDALDPGAVDAHVDVTVLAAGRVDVSLNVTSLRGDVQVAG